jgi:hypothetical protein
MCLEIRCVEFVVPLEIDMLSPDFSYPSFSTTKICIDIARSQKQHCGPNEGGRSGQQ